MDHLAFIKDVSAIATSVAIAAATLLTVFRKGAEDRSVQARQEKQLSLAKARLELWEKRMDIETSLLSGSSLDDARMRARLALDDIWMQTNSNLQRIAQQGSHSKQSVRALWRRILLLYPPVRASRTNGYVLRGLYLLSFASFLLFGLAFLVAATLLIVHRPDTSARVHDSVNVATLLVAYLSMAVVTAKFRSAVLSEEIPSKLIEPEQI